MSLAHSRWAWEQGAAHQLEPLERFVLVYLADQVNKAGEHWCNRARIQQFTGLGPASVGRVIAKLTAVGLLKLAYRHRCRLYCLQMPPPANGLDPHPMPGKALRHRSNRSKSTPSTSIPQIEVTSIPQIDVAPSERLNGGLDIDPTDQCTSIPQIDYPITYPLREERKEGPPLSPVPGEVCEILAGFQLFWELYPRKVGKRAAFKAYNAAVKRANGERDILAGLQDARFADDPRYIPHPTTWLNGDRWLDEEDTTDPVLRVMGLHTAGRMQ